jgi:multidrug transporter EmrE-like cation transporter
VLASFRQSVWLLAFLSIGLSAGAQLLMKIGMSGPRPQSAGLEGLVQAVLNPWVLAGLGCYGLSAILWLSVLSRMPLSLAYPLVSVAIAAVVVLSAVLFGEPIPAPRAWGVVLIVIGVGLIGLRG